MLRPSIPQSLENVPDVLRNRNCWVGWSFRAGTNGTRTKVPVRPTGAPARTNDPSHWSTFDRVREAYEGFGQLDGVGLCFAGCLDIVAIDLDSCRYDDGSLTPWAQEIVDSFGSYTEVTPSGSGIRIIGLGSWSATAKVAKGMMEAAAPNKAPEIRVFHHSGYVTVTGQALAHDAVCDISGALKWLASAYFEEAKKSGPVSQPTEAEMAKWPSYESRLRRAKKYLTTTFPHSIEGAAGSDVLFKAALALIKGFALEYIDALEILEGFNAQKCIPPWPDSELERKLAGASSATKVRLGYLLKDDFEGVAYPEDFAWMGDPNKQTDHELARRFTQRFASQLRFVPEWGKWLIWDGRRWCIDQKQVQAMGLVRSFCDELWNGYGPLAKSMTQKQAGALHQFLKYSSKRHTIESVLKLATSEKGLLTDKDLLNATPRLLNVLNGTIDLRDGKLHGHKQEQLITQLAPIHYDPNAKCPQWESFLEMVFDGDQDLIRYVRQLIGYSASGDAGEHILPICIGTGANGKSTLWNTILGILGDYGSLANESLLVGRADQHPTQIAALYGKRFVPISEPDQSAQLRESRVKELTGDSTVTARRMHEDFWSFTRTHTFWMATNHLPKVSGNDEGIWRRIKVIPFNVDLRLVTKPIPGFDKKLVKEEASGILNWIIAGAKDYFDNGFEEPSCVRLATGRYRGGEDELGNFVNECCEVGRGLVVTAADVFNAYVQWGGKQSRTSFGKAFSDRFDKEQPQSGPHRKVWIYHGVRVSQGGGEEIQWLP
jgi:putative DNA primase/helicase